MSELLRNAQRASMLLPELDKVARNVPRKGSKTAAFTGHTAFQDELAAKIGNMRRAFAEAGIPTAFNDSMAGAPLAKCASLERPDEWLMLRAGAEEAMEKCAAMGDAATFEICAEAAVALDAAAEIERYIQSGGTEKVAQLGEVGTPLAGAAIGAAVGAGGKWLLSSPNAKKRGLSRLLDAALLGAAAGGIGGWALNKSHEAGQSLPGESSAASARTFAQLAAKDDPELAKAIADAKETAAAVAKADAEFKAGGAYLKLDKGEGEIPAFTAAVLAKRQLQQNLVAADKQWAVMSALASRAEKANQPDLAKVYGAQAKQAYDVINNQKRNMGQLYKAYDLPEGYVGRKLNQGLTGAPAPQDAGILDRLKTRFAEWRHSDADMAALPEGQAKPGQLFDAWRGTSELVNQSGTYF